jgi:hypothetical protein
MPKLLIALDLETNHHNKPRMTNGTDISIGVLDTKILEVGFIIYEQTIVNGEVVLKEVLTHQSYVYNESETVWGLAPKVVLDLHTKSGFKEAYDQFVKDCEYNSVAKETYSEKSVDMYMSALIKTTLLEHYPTSYNEDMYLAGDLNALTLVGKNPQFDIGFVNTRFPRTAMYLDYRVFDVSLIRNALKTIGNGKLKGVSKRPSTHHAIEDCKSAMDGYKETLEVFLEKFPDTVEYFQDYKQN